MFYRWCCALEKHKKLGFHYHLLIKLDRNHRWLKSKEHLLRQYGISVHYLSSHENCFSAWCYVTKEDKYYKQSTGHPDLRNRSEPRTSAAALRCNENDGDDELADGSDDEQPFRLKNKKKEEALCIRRSSNCNGKRLENHARTAITRLRTEKRG